MFAKNYSAQLQFWDMDFVFVDNNKNREHHIIAFATVWPFMCALPHN